MAKSSRLSFLGQLLCRVQANFEKHKRTLESVIHGIKTLSKVILVSGAL